jgi:type I restriction enzyme S subunit
MCYAPPEGGAASTEFVVLHGIDGIPPEAVWAACGSQQFSSAMLSLVTGTTGSHQRVDKGALLEIVVPDPRTLSQEELHAVTGLVQEANGSRDEAQRLADVRDELLPLLMSGRVSVDEAWEAVG